MPLKLAVGRSEKLGRPDYGSVGASCSVELELDGSLLADDPAAFRRRVEHAFELCRDAVQAELARASDEPPRSDAPVNGARRDSPPRRAATNSAPRNGGRRPATTAQVQAILAIARKRRLDLATELANRYGVTRPEELSLREASELLDALRPAAPAGA
jgi:hypothetical protein